MTSAFKATTPNIETMILKHHLINSIIVTIGFVLSPLTWWNDLIVNVPPAYFLSLPFSLIDEKLFLPSFILGYWLTNLLGFVMLHWGSEGLIHRKYTQFGFKKSIFVSVIYSIIVIIFVLLDWLSPPTEYLRFL